MATTGDGWAERYRQKWTWDSVTWGTHSVDCYPGGCPFRVYTRDGRVIREEQAGALPSIDSATPDMNPMGCQKGACWSHCHYSPDRVTQPLKRDRASEARESSRRSPGTRRSATSPTGSSTPSKTRARSRSSRR